MRSLPFSVASCLASGCVEHLKIIQLFVQNICQACFPQAGTPRAVLLQSKVPPKERWEQIPAVVVESQAACSPLFLLPTNQTLPRCCVQWCPSPFPLCPSASPCCLLLSADGWAGSLPAASPGLVPPLPWWSTCGRSPGDRADKVGTPGWVSFLLLWLLGMFLSRNNTVPRLPLLVFSDVSAVKISGLGCVK